MHANNTSKNALIGAAGLLSGTGYAIARRNPETVLPILKLSAASGLAGALLGWGLAAYKNSPTHILVLSLGANFGVTSAMFLSKPMLQTSVHESPARAYIYYTYSGLVGSLEILKWLR